MQSRPDEQLLDALYAAERARDASPAGSPTWERAVAEAQALREVYYRVTMPAAAPEPAEPEGDPARDLIS